MSLNLNDVGPQRSFDPIPEGTVVSVEMTIRPGDVGEGGWLRRSKDGRSEALDCEFVVVEGEFVKRKLWQLFTLEGSTPGHAQAGDISRRTLRAILESVRGIKPSDNSEEAKKARVAEFAELNGLRFLIRVGVEPARDGYKAKNTIAEVITPDKPVWRAIEQAPKTAASAAPAASGSGSAPQLQLPPIAKPEWAQR